MKKRTRVVAWAFAIYLFGVAQIIILLIPGTIAKYHVMPWRIVGEAIAAMTMGALWTALLMRKSWAWWSLVIVNSVFLVWTIWNAVRIPDYLTAHNKLLIDPGGMMALNCAWIGLAYVLPIIFLLTDRPTGRTNPKSEMR